ncbi:hypothetical protein GCM10010329_01040 [Streptomyces spiroverticillatus]|uniref:Uncharacterized protein n=1 Tax=Streptomyces finlayi TaxID=67296 RepID=A0A918WS15_9ACTN|nr:hypothetical protein [Streptomyces finlayi]GGZ85273.1 hypothetical protein GCM10010329_01040 [Streptomyces spiroverticillatus]GHC76933.1 hypothetical protein GCM10010334_01030 [Streptomyces finlayi]
MNTFMDYLAVAFVFALLALPSLIGHLGDLRIDRQLRDAERADAERAGTPEGIPARPSSSYSRAA